MSYIGKTRKVSVAMAIYNCATTLREAIESIIAQTYTDWELIMCDDASTDETLKIALEYAERSENIFVIRNAQNLGLPASLNRCIELAKGKYIARMDGDDISLPERFEVEVSFLDTHPEYAIVSCAMINFDENGEWGIQRKPEYPTKMDFIYDSPFCHAPCMMRKDALADVGYYTVREELRRGQDYFLWHKFYCKGYKGYNFQTPYYKMRDDKSAAKRRSLKAFYNSAKMQYLVYKDLGIPIKYYYRILRTLLVGVIPKPIYLYLHKRGINKK